eukprot:TRINITY_DN9543_c0_g1_i1.p1 TRINITY_DN9543_c0_g1~~TRINITY_DN9543_c0_g1_i1.p1  ORF type:complete len:267 (-),score=34.34 TRINITY_DN9543_c0_g1_i1:353-1153(-)
MGQQPMRCLRLVYVMLLLLCCAVSSLSADRYIANHRPRHAADRPIRKGIKLHRQERSTISGGKVPRNHSTHVQQFKCPHVEKIGETEGGWFTCITPTLNKKSVVYSFGLGNDPMFDLRFIEKFGGIVHAFDPTPTGYNLYKKWEKKPKQWIYHEWGINGEDGNMSFVSPAIYDQYSIRDWDGTFDKSAKIIRQGYKLSTIMKLLGHQHIDICKIDVEGSEWLILQDLVENPPNVDQLFIEFHYFDLTPKDNYSPQCKKRTSCSSGA